MTRLLRIVFWPAALFAFVMAVLPQPVELLGTSDKVQHMAAFFVLTSLGSAAYRGAPRLGLLAAMAGFGGLIELVQMLPMLGRDAEWSDWLADILDIALALAAAQLVERSRAAD
jgi:hypothetical protein